VSGKECHGDSPRGTDDTSWPEVGQSYRQWEQTERYRDGHIWSGRSCSVQDVELLLLLLVLVLGMAPTAAVLLVSSVLPDECCSRFLSDPPPFPKAAALLRLRSFNEDDMIVKRSKMHSSKD
jgi:hypothetical protein